MMLSFGHDLRLLRANSRFDQDERSKELMSRGWKCMSAVAGLLVMLCKLATGPAQAQYAYPYPYPAAPPVAAPPVAPPVVAAPPLVAAYPYVWGGRRFCWYNRAWNGPGWYWCGYAFRSGYGWGGGHGWNGWVWHGGRGWRGDRYYH
jgi:hypothetical protein